ncbi:MAG: hypothetical protein WCI72_02260 [archaeon]
MEDKTTIDMTNPEAHVNRNPDSQTPITNEPIEIPVKKKTVEQRVAYIGERVVIGGLLAMFLTGTAETQFKNYRDRHAPELVREYSDIGPATTQLREAMARTTTGYVLDVNRDAYKSEGIVSQLVKAQDEMYSAQTKQFASLSGIATKLKMRGQEIEKQNPEVLAYIGKTNSIASALRCATYVSAAATFLSSMGAFGLLLYRKRKEEENKVQPIEDKPEEKTA